MRAAIQHDAPAGIVGTTVRRVLLQRVDAPHQLDATAGLHLVANAYLVLRLDTQRRGTAEVHQAAPKVATGRIEDVCHLAPGHYQTMHIGIAGRLNQDGTVDIVRAEFAACLHMDTGAGHIAAADQGDVLTGLDVATRLGAPPLYVQRVAADCGLTISLDPHIRIAAGPDDIVAPHGTTGEDTSHHLQITCA
ncbi:MAG: hypothetical protein AW11_01358 [Candidatus Accumulibacter regalis]|uniref:Uncharacterized protein n=1 Tax=Accumulibacter regalis TaxID=522306 RepID=A0A011QKW4_ACCRE|nr:MAG: hypothetical protein AW11_01358 [Candidatus Accumulibacter regalis]